MPSSFFDKTFSWETKRVIDYQEWFCGSLSAAQCQDLMPSRWHRLVPLGLGGAIGLVLAHDVWEELMSTNFRLMFSCRCRALQSLFPSARMTQETSGDLPLPAWVLQWGQHGEKPPLTHDGHKAQMRRNFCGLSHWEFGAFCTIKTNSIGVFLIDLEVPYIY